MASPGALPNYGMARVFNVNKAEINSMDFYRDGSYLVTSSDDESIRIYDAVAGRDYKTVFAQKYGVGCVRFSHTPLHVVCTSRNIWDHSLRYLSLNENTYIRYFKGHTDEVTGLALDPRGDSFLSSSKDKTVRLWDLRTNLCQGRLTMSAPTHVAIDPRNSIFAAAAGNVIKLFDIRSCDAGPFATFTLNTSTSSCERLSISNDGELMLLVTAARQVIVLNAMDGEVVHTFMQTTDQTAKGPVCEASFSPDTAYVISGDPFGHVHVWSRETGEELADWDGHTGPTRCAQWNPRKQMIASSCTSLAFWIPYE